MEVRAREGETFEQLLKRFKMGVERSGLLREYKRKQRFKPKGEVRRDKARAAARRRRRSGPRRRVGVTAGPTRLATGAPAAPRPWGPQAPSIV